MHLVKVPENRIEEMFNEFYNKSMFTFEGIELKDKKGMEMLTAHLEERGIKDPMGYWFTGKEMNEHYGLTEKNAYNNNLTFLVVPGLYDPAYKMAFGGKARWFDDIVSNNTIRQNAINHKTTEDFGEVRCDMKEIEGVKYFNEEDFNEAVQSALHSALEEGVRHKDMEMGMILGLSGSIIASNIHDALFGKRKNEE